MTAVSPFDVLGWMLVVGFGGVGLALFAMLAGVLWRPQNTPLGCIPLEKSFAKKLSKHYN